MSDLSGDEFLQLGDDITRLFDNVQATVPGVTTDMVSMVVWNTIEDFYQRSTIRREHVYWCLEPGKTVLDFDPYDKPRHTWRVCRFLGFTGLSNFKITPPGRVVDLSCPPPDSQRQGEAYLALKPDNLQTLLPYDVLTNYFEVLYSGACYRLYLQSGKPYTNPQAGGMFARIYRAGVASARAEAQAHHLRDGNSWHFPYFATGGRANGRAGL
jgi:hypothetical protein